MHVEVGPDRFEPIPGIAQPVTVTITNTGSVIGGYTIRVLGADPSWVTLPDTDVTLFPDETRSVDVLLTVPAGMVAGERRIAVQVREQTPPHDSVVEDVVLVVPERPAMRLRVDPISQTAGRAAKLSVLVANEGNSPLTGYAHGQDAEGKVRFAFDPPELDLAPGENQVVDVLARSRRPFAGTMRMRMLELRLLDAAQHAELELTRKRQKERPAGKLTRPEKVAAKRRRKAPVLVNDDIPAQAQATVVQRPVFSRGSLSLVGLLVAVTVFAIVITVALSRIVGQSVEDRNLALEIAAARTSGTGVGTADLGGAVSLLTSGKSVRGVSVSVFGADDTEAALATTATDKDGRWSVGELPAGDYKVTFRGAGFTQLWYPLAITPEDAEAITLEPGASRADLDVALGGVPSTISGKVVGPDVAAAIVTLKAPLRGATALAPGTENTTGTPGDDPLTPTAAEAAEGATIVSVPINAEGTFELTGVPSPSIYDLVVEKEGFATSTQRIDVGAGEERTGVEITLRQGDGVLRGTVASDGTALEGATVSATTGQTSVTTQTLSDGAPGSPAGAFVLRNLPTPATFTLVVSKEGYASQTLTVTLGDGQELGGLAVDLDLSSGQIAGLVRLDNPSQELGTSVGGTVVTVTDGTTVVQTATQTGPGFGGQALINVDEDDPDAPVDGEWQVSGLPVPGDYTITFTRDDLATQTVAVSLDGQGNLLATGEAGYLQDGQVVVDLTRATGTVYGTVRQQRADDSTRAAGEVVVQLTSNLATYSVVSASVPDELAGQFRFDSVPPGTYTLQTSKSGVAPRTSIVTVTAGEDIEVPAESLVLALPASVSGQVTFTDGTSVGANWVVELYRSSEYPTVSYQSTTTNAQGIYHFPDVEAPQTYVVQVRRSQASAPRGTARQSIEPSEDKDIPVTVRGDG